MILDTLENSARYENLNVNFKKGFDYLKTITAANFPEQKKELNGEDLFALFHKGNGNGPENIKLEAHNKYIDIHYIISGEDLMALKNTTLCCDINKAFSEKEDYILYNDIPQNLIKIPENHFMIVYPEDAHAPLLGTTEIYKIILKVKV
ncbi:MAG: hypothetical protein JWO32_1886 [Bacteroidetes bacterium]|nr:hypothetical protein [Bacteroidota bacterium]